MGGIIFVRLEEREEDEKEMDKRKWEGKRERKLGDFDFLFLRGFLGSRVFGLVNFW